MLKFKTFLKEGRDSSLYHGTSFGSFLNIMKINKIDGTSFHNVGFINGGDGVSLTRDFRFAKNWKSDVVLELDQRKLTHNYKIVPIDYFRNLEKDRRRNFSAESEEFVVGDLKNVKNYIIRIWIENLYSRYPQNIINKLGLYGKFHFMELSPEKYGKNDDIKEFDYAISQSEIKYEGSEGLIISPQDEITYNIILKNTKWNKQINFKKFNKNNLIIVTPNRLFLFNKYFIYDERNSMVSMEYFNNKYPWVLDNIKLSKSQKIISVKENPHAIEYIKNPSEAVQMAAVKNDGSVIQYIKNPSEELQLLSVTQYINAIEYIKNPSEKVKKYVEEHI